MDGRGVKQGCPLSPCLFALLLVNLDEVLEEGGWGGKDRGKENLLVSVCE